MQIKGYKDGEGIYGDDLFDQLVECRGFIEEALIFNHGAHDFSDIVFGVLSGSLLFWRLRDCFIITEFHQYGRYQSIHIFLAGGKKDSLSDLIELQEDLTKYAKETQCEYVSILGRQGWIKVLRDCGWSPNDLFYLEKRLKED